MHFECCMECADRWVDPETFQTCHNTCEKYAKALSKYREERKARADEYQSNAYMRKTRAEFYHRMDAHRRRRGKFR